MTVQIPFGYWRAKGKTFDITGYHSGCLNVDDGTAIVVLRKCNLPVGTAVEIWLWTDYEGELICRAEGTVKYNGNENEVGVDLSDLTVIKTQFVLDLE